jgi:hypothetical protein
MSCWKSVHDPEDHGSRHAMVCVTICKQKPSPATSSAGRLYNFKENLNLAGTAAHLHVLDDILLICKQAGLGNRHRKNPQEGAQGEVGGWGHDRIINSTVRMGL